MATLREALNTSTDGYVQVTTPRPQAPPPPDNNQPGASTVLRCPLPPIYADPDSLRQFYKGNQVPQMRVMPPPVQTASSGGGTVVENVSVTGSASSSSSSSSSTITAKSAGITTPMMNPGSQFTGSLSTSSSLQLLSISANQACRIRLYGTRLAQTQDLGRALDAPPSAGTVQNLLSDLALDTPPYQWSYQNRIGANGDNPQNQTLYITVTNLGTASAVITISLTYVPLES